MATGTGEALAEVLEQRWTIVQDADKVDVALRSELGVEVDEELVEDGVSYISLKSDPVRVTEVVGKLESDKEQVQRGDVNLEWVPAVPHLFLCESPDAAVAMFTLRIQPYYRKVGPDAYSVKVELLDIIWDGKLEKNQKNERGFFVDVVTISLTPQWRGDDRFPSCPISFSPGAPDDPISWQNTKQSSTQVGFTGARPSAALTFGKSRSQGSSSQPWVIKWKRSSESGSATLELALNMLCSGSGKSYISYNINNPLIGKWGGGDVPQLPPPYDGSFNGCSGELSAEWSVQESVFQAKKVCWKADVSLRLSSLSGQMGAQYFGSQRRWDKRQVLIKPKASTLIYCLRPASWEDSFTTFNIGTALLIALLPVAVAFWQIHGN